MLFINNELRIEWGVMIHWLFNIISNILNMETIFSEELFYDTFLLIKQPTTAAVITIILLLATHLWTPGCSGFSKPSYTTEQFVW